jgi:SAM-dependent methyltransferase
MPDKLNTEKEKKFIENLVPDYITSADSSQVRLMRDLIIRTFKPYISKHDMALELGCEIGYMSENIAPLVKQIDIVDGSEEFIRHVKSRNISNARFFVSLFEEYKADYQYDCVFASHVLEHLVDVQVVLKMIKSVLKPGGYFFVTVPNARALSRQLARHMNLMRDLYELTPNDLRGGHRRVYDQVLLKRDIVKAGFDICIQGGILFKPFADFQMDKLIDVGVIGQLQSDGLYNLGFEYPDMCADVYIIARRPFGGEV